MIAIARFQRHVTNPYIQTTSFGSGSKLNSRRIAFKVDRRITLPPIPQCWCFKKVRRRLLVSFRGICEDFIGFLNRSEQIIAFCFNVGAISIIRSAPCTRWVVCPEPTCPLSFLPTATTLVEAATNPETTAMVSFLNQASLDTYLCFYSHRSVNLMNKRPTRIIRTDNIWLRKEILLESHKQSRKCVRQGVQRVLRRWYLGQQPLWSHFSVTSGRCASRLNE